LRSGRRAFTIHTTLSEHGATRGEGGEQHRDALLQGRPGAYVGALAALALALAASWAYYYGVFALDPRFLAGAAASAGLLLAAESFPVRVGERTELSAAGVVLASSVAVLGPLWAALACLPAALLVGRGNPQRVAYEASRRTVEVFAAGAVFAAVSGPLLAPGTPPAHASSVFYATLAAGAVLLGANFVLDAGLLYAKYGQGFARSWEENVRPYLASDAVNVLTAGLGVLALLLYGPLAAAVLVAGSVAGHALALRSREQSRRVRGLEAEVESLRGALSGAGETFGALVVGALGRKDGYTDRHAAATAVYARDLALELKLGERRAEQLRLAGLLHNVGMASLPEELLKIPGRPNSLAKSKLAEHPALGQRALAAVPGFGEVARWVRWHHERPDGRGYPDKLRGPWIPVEAKVLAVAQAYAAMVLDGPSRPGVGPGKAREALVAGMGSEFDGGAVKGFLRILDTETEGYRAADDHRFVLPRAGRVGDVEEAGEGR
jgi:HD-GYP domain-containing protein (c-di-GMP phosphodiesterase class II)